MDTRQKIDLSDQTIQDIILNLPLPTGNYSESSDSEDTTVDSDTTKSGVESSDIYLAVCAQEIENIMITVVDHIHFLWVIRYILRYRGELTCVDVYTYLYSIYKIDTCHYSYNKEDFISLYVCVIIISALSENKTWELYGCSTVERC